MDGPGEWKRDYLMLFLCSIFSHDGGSTDGNVWSKLKYPNNFWMDSHFIIFVKCPILFFQRRHRPICWFYDQIFEQNGFPLSISFVPNIKPEACWCAKLRRPTLFGCGLHRLGSTSSTRTDYTHQLVDSITDASRARVTVWLVSIKSRISLRVKKGTDGKSYSTGLLCVIGSPVTPPTPTDTIKHSRILYSGIFPLHLTSLHSFNSCSYLVFSDKYF